MMAAVATETKRGKTRIRHRQGAQRVTDDTGAQSRPLPRETVHVYRPTEHVLDNPLRAGLALEHVPEPLIIVLRHR